MKELVLNVKGMMCGGCENRVKNVLGEIEGVKNVTADHTTGKVVVTYENDISKETISSAIEDIGYEVEKKD
ncbi:MAG: heavy-metal-associated domain-containing protein [Clostridia bacterium]|nr:heavy-metal-associated domain-containing protein [Clostridia bacterium]